MKWYVASLLFKAIHSQPVSQDDLWEERLVLLSADTLDAARQMAQATGNVPVVGYAGEGDDQIIWTFRHVERVYEIQQAELQSGTEIFSRFLKTAEVQSLLSKLPDIV